VTGRSRIGNLQYLFSTISLRPTGSFRGNLAQQRDLQVLTLTRKSKHRTEIKKCRVVCLMFNVPQCGRFLRWCSSLLLSASADHTHTKRLPVLNQLLESAICQFKFPPPRYFRPLHTWENYELCGSAAQKKKGGGGVSPLFLCTV
jgi:hypothetical protein